MSQGTELDGLSAEAERIRAAGGLGRSRMLLRLFDYLLVHTLKGESPKEVAIAAEVFGKTESDLLVDASVRVYVHRLRKKLDDFYAQTPGADGTRLSLPKGDYRFRLIAGADEAEQDAAEEAGAGVGAVGRAIASPWRAVLLGLVLGAALMMAVAHFWAPSDPVASVRASGVWAPFTEGNAPLTLVAGDYYIMGERDKPDAEPSRLVREYAVNSREDLDALLMDRPELRDRLVDLDLYYLPVSTAYAIKSIMPIMAGAQSGRANTPVIPSSKLTPADFKHGDIIYVGLMSGLGVLHQPVFANSRFDFAGSFDELIDTQTGKIYVADPPQNGETARRNYAYVAKLPGPNGNHILIIAGTRDPALLQAADIMTSPAQLAQLEKAGKDGYFEALFAVDGVGDENLKGTLIAVGPRTADGLWNGVGDMSATTPEGNGQ